MNPTDLGIAGGQAWFGRTYSLKFIDKSGNLIQEIYSDERNGWQGLRINFEIKQQVYFVNQMAKISIYNLSDQSKRQISNASRVVLSAGYQLNSGIIYQGNIVNVYDLRVQPDYQFLLFCLDYQDIYEPISTTIAAGTSPSDAIKQLVSQVPELEVNDKNLLNLPTTGLDRSIYFPMMEYTAAFKKLGILLDIHIWVSNGNVYAAPRLPSSYPQDSSTIEIDYSTGMIGSPFFNLANSGVNVTSLLNHLLAPGNLVKIKTLAPEIQIGQANYVNFNQDSITRGTWQILSVDHRGDNWDGDWISFIQSFSFAPLGKNVL